MSTRAVLDFDREALAELCRRFEITHLELFGSALRDDFRPDSDVDLLVSFAPGRTPGMRELQALDDELEAIFGRVVDVVMRRAVEEGRNPIRRDHILTHRETLYAR